MKKLTFFVFLLMASNGLLAKRFASQYAEFELPPSWSCALEGTEWVCQSDNKDRKKEAIIIMAAKIRGAQDGLTEYKAYLKKPKTFNLPGGKTQVSEASYSKVKTINNHRWVDSLHLASEVPGFYTRYIATVKEDLGVAVTFSVSKEHYNSYQKVFDNVISTIRVFRQKNVDVGKFALKSARDDILDGNTTFIPDVNNQFEIGVRNKGKKNGSSESDDSFFYLIFLVLGIFIYLKMKKGKKSSKKKKKKVKK